MSRYNRVVVLLAGVMLDTRLIGHLLRLRYQLLWAQTRTRAGKVALFVTGYLFVVLIVVLLAMGGMAAALAAVRAHETQLVARLVLTGFFMNALVAAVVMGFGMNAVFSDAALRRFPLRSLDRLAARQLIAFAEPLWIIVLGLDVGLAVGFYALGGSSFWLNAIAAILLAVNNYLLARVLLNAVEHIMNTRAGSLLLMIFVLMVSVLPGLVGPRLLRRPAVVDRAIELLQWSPPFQAAAVMSADRAGDAAAPLGWLLLAGAVLLAAIFVFERHPPATRTVAKAAAEWDSRYDRVAAWFGSSRAPLVSKVLRYYLRSNRVRFNFFLAVPLVTMLASTQSRKGGPMALFGASLGAIGLVGFIGTAAMAVNQFGYDAGGLRRYFLLPLAPAAVFQASSLATLALGTVQIPLAFLVWFAFAGVHTTPVMLVMLISSATGGLLLFNGLALWTTLLAPRRCDFTTTFGNNLSFGGNLLIIGGVMTMMILPAVLRATKRLNLVLEYWWALPVFLVVAAAFYTVSLRAGARVFVERRERLLAVMEGRD